MVKKSRNKCSSVSPGFQGHRPQTENVLFWDHPLQLHRVDVMVEREDVQNEFGTDLGALEFPNKW